jgi:hypothetical protein
VPTLVGIDHGFSFPLRYFEFIASSLTGPHRGRTVRSLFGRGWHSSLPPRQSIDAIVDAQSLVQSRRQPIELIRLERKALKNLRTLIKEKTAASNQAEFLAPLDAGTHGVVFAIVTHKDKSKKSRNLPLFSRISLMRNLKALQVMNVKAGFRFVQDKSAKTQGRKKTRKKKAEEPA